MPMKKSSIYVFCVLLILFIFNYSAFANNEGTVMRNNNSLVLYYSLTKKTDALAKIIQKERASELHKISFLSCYLPFLNSFLMPKEEERIQMQNLGKIAELNDISNYDTIYLGFPVWFDDMPFFMYKFLSKYDFTDKKIHLFITAGASDIGEIISNIKALLPKAQVESSLFINKHTKEEPEKLVKEWLAQAE